MDPLPQPIHVLKLRVFRTDSESSACEALETAMLDELIDVPWDRVRSGPTVRRADGTLDRVVVVEPRGDTVDVWFHSGCHERHRGEERAVVVTHRPDGSPRHPVGVDN